MKLQTIKSLFSTGVPILFVGAAGVGKTEKINHCFDYVETLLLSSESEENIGGLPWRDGQYDYRTTPALFRRLTDADTAGKTTALFLDEIDKADRQVADTLLTLVASRKINDNHLPAKTVIVAAANPPEYGGGDGLSIPMLNRFSVVEFKPSLSEWAGWAMETFRSKHAHNVVALALRGDFEILETVGEGLETRTTSPRSLAFALKTIESGIDEECTELMLRGILTPNAATKIMHTLNFKKPYDGILEKAAGLMSEAQAGRVLKKTRKPLEV